jgi:hypothetical protein
MGLCMRLTSVGLWNQPPCPIPSVQQSAKHCICVPKTSLVPEIAWLVYPSDVHHGLAEQRMAARAAVLATAYAAHPERFPGGLPQPPACPTDVWINPPHSLGRSHAASSTRPSDLPSRAPSRSLPSIAAQSSRL